MRAFQIADKASTELNWLEALCIIEGC